MSGSSPTTDDALLPVLVDDATLAPDDLRDLERAVALLTTPSLTVRLTALVGSPLERAMARLPKGAAGRIRSTVEAALGRAVRMALWKMDDVPERAASTKLHKAATAMTGAAGGFFGWTGLLVEIPVTTTLMMRAIADVARSEGFSIADPRTQQDCIAVFSMGGSSSADDAAETGYYAARAMIEEVAKVAGAALIAHAARRGVEQAGQRIVLRSLGAGEAGALLAKLIEAVASRLGVVFTHKAAAQMAPVIGAAGGATINALFTNHFQDMARGHFIVLRLEGRYGQARIEAEFRRIAASRRGRDATPVMPPV